MLASVTTTAQTLVGATSGANASYGNIMGIVLRAPSTNTGNIHIGKANTVTASGALTAGLSLEPGNALTVPPQWAADANLIYVISSTGTQNLIWDLRQALPS